ncbi:hypothetical protein Tco_1106827 [Tanacetum coccineum]
MDQEDDQVTKKLYKDVNVNLGNEDADMTDADQGGAGQQNVSQESGFEQVEEDAHLLNLENPSLDDNEIASLMDTIVCHEEPGSQTLSLYTVPIMTVPKITSVFTTTIPPPPPFFNPLPQQATPALTPTTSVDITSFPSLLDFLSVFKFNDRITNLEKDMSEIKQVDQYAQALSSIPTIVDRYIDNKLGESIQKAILAHNLDCKEEAHAEKRDYIELILPQAVSDFATPVIEKNVTESLEATVLARSSSQPKFTYEADASLSEELYDALAKSYQTNKDLFDTYGEVFTLKRNRDDKDKDQDPFAGSDRGTKRRKSSKETESSRDSRSKEKKSSSSSKDASHSKHKPSGKSAYAEEPSHTVDDSGVQQNQEFNTGNNVEQPADKEVSKADWFKKPERPPTPDPDWNKRQHVDFRPPQTWISQVAGAKEPTTSFDELINTPIDFSAFVLNQLNIKDLTQAILVGPTFDLHKGTCKSLTELEYHLKECSKATTERLDWYNPEGKPYPFDLSKPLPLILDHRGRQVIPRDFFINNDLEYLKGGELSRRYLTSVTKIKAATYEIKWIEDLVQNLWSPVKGDFPRLSLQDIKDMLLLLVQQKLTNLTKDEWYDLNVALRMFTRRIVIQRQVEDLQLGVESYQKKLNLTKPDTFSDGTLNDVRTVLHDIASGIRMEYLPKRKRSGLDKRRAWVMINDIEK